MMSGLHIGIFLIIEGTWLINTYMRLRTVVTYLWKVKILFIGYFAYICMMLVEESQDVHIPFAKYCQDSILNNCLKKC